LIIAAARKDLFKTSDFLKTALVCTALVAAVAYGRWRISQADKFIEAGPSVASLQSNVPQSVKRSFQASEKIFNDLLIHSNESAEAGAELIVWPETMVQGRLDPRVLRFLVSSDTDKIFDKRLSEHSKNTAFVLVGAYGGIAEIQEDFTIRLAQRYNSAFLYKPDGRQSKKRYSKIHLVPFGEFVPFRKSFPFLYNLLMKFTPYDYDYTLDAGSEYTVFEMTGGQGQELRVYKFSVMICYEDAVPAIARRFAIDKRGQKRLDWLVNISNDGWFVRFKNGKVLPSTELPQHAAICVFRAVENRLAVLRSVNTGISCLIDTLGHIHNGFIAGNLPQHAMARTGCAGWFVDRVTIDKRTTFFSKYGQWLDFCCAICLVSLIIVPPLRRFVRTKKYTTNLSG
jgi:apolipoprotein N-acyltransferase